MEAYKKLKGIEAEDALSLMMDKAAKQAKEPEKLDPDVIRPIFSTEESAEESIYGKVAGASEEPIDWSAALERLRKVKEEQ